jgi:transposase
MKKTVEEDRQLAVQRYFHGESPENIYLSIGRSKAWLYKWVGRYDPDNPGWYRDNPRSLGSDEKLSSNKILGVPVFPRRNNKRVFCLPK